MGVIAHRLRRIRATHRAVREWLRTASAEGQQVEPKRRPQGRRLLFVPVLQQLAKRLPAAFTVSATALGASRQWPVAGPAAVLGR
jgi:hypothetical protein